MDRIKKIVVTKSHEIKIKLTNGNEVLIEAECGEVKDIHVVGSLSKLKGKELRTILIAPELEAKENDVDGVLFIGGHEKISINNPEDSYPSVGFVVNVKGCVVKEGFKGSLFNVKG